MPEGVGDYKAEGGLAKGKGNEFPDFIPPNVEERWAAEYAAVRDGFLAGVHAGISRGMGEEEILDEWCREEGHDRKRIALAAVRLNLVPEAHYAALVRAEVRAEAEPELAEESESPRRGKR